MKRRKVLLCLAVVMVLAVLIPAPMAAQEEEDIASQLQAALEAAVESPDTNFPGALLYVRSPEFGPWIGAAGLGDIETGTAMRPDDKFRCGSIMKPFISVVTLQLVEEGRFSLDDPMPAVLPESVTARFADSDQITVRMLLNHTSGIADFVTEAVVAEIFANPTKVWEDDEWLDIAAAQEPYFAPGEGWTYSNTDYILLGLVIEQATGRSWREEVRQRVIEPLNLENTLLPEPGDRSIPGNHARGYHDMGGEFVDLTGVDPSMAGAAGGHALVSTTTDLARFLEAVLAGELFQNDETLDEMLTLVDKPEGVEADPGGWAVGYGLGMMKYVLPGGIEILGHEGGTAGYVAFTWYLPAQGITISGAMNHIESIMTQVLFPALEVLIPEFSTPEPEVAFTPPITDADGNVIPGSIASLEKVTLGGVEQWILIRGADTTKPVLLWLHGGPGVPAMPFVGLFQTPELEANFVVVQWDQRGAGKSFSEDLTAEDMRGENFVSDTLELTEILRERFNQDKIFLFGHSWGSALGFMTIMENSEPYYAYIAAAERVDWSRSQTISYEWVMEQAQENNDTEVIQVLESIQPFDPTNPEHIAAKSQFLDLYLGGDCHTEGLCDTYFEYALSGKSPEYTSADIEKTLAGLEFTRQTLGLEALQYHLSSDFVSPIPVHFFAGRYDYHTPGELAEEYFNLLEAPAKSFTWFENSGHSMIWDEPDKTTQELIRIAEEDIASQLQAALEAAVESPDTNFPGALLYVRSPEFGPWIGAAGLGDIETGTAMRPDDKFRCGSIMKPFISVVTLQLVEEGRFSLDDPMPAVLPESVTARFADSDQITVRMLLNHTSGIADFVTEAVVAEIFANPTKVWEDDEWLDIAAAQEPYFAPGEGWTYSNTDYILLGLVIEQATGRSWREEVRQRVIEPLNLENTLLPEPGDRSIPGNHARGYHDMGGEFVDLTGVDPSMAGAAGGHALVSTTTDLARFLDAVLAGELFQNDETLDEMLAFVDAPDEAGVPYYYGLGMEKYVFPGGIELIGHAGGTAGFSAVVYYLPAQDITVAGMINIQDLGSAYYQILLPALEILIPESSP